MNSIAAPLLNWWDEHGRKDLPWQLDASPYRVWVSEIMLQQTQVTTVERYFDRFMQAFPAVDDLAAASEDDVLHQWSGLGYYSRARNLHKAARLIVAEFAGELPDTLDGMLALPGVGRSTAGAVLALSREQHHPILDGNAKRVLARYFAVHGWSGSTQNLKILWQHAEACTPVDRVANYTQAIMDLGATLCKRGRPACDLCPLQDDCKAYALGQTREIPAPKPKKARPRRSAFILMARSQGDVLLEKRPSQGIWGGLWSFPEFESEDAAIAWLAQRFRTTAQAMRAWPAVEHAFSHYDFVMQPLEIELNTRAGEVADKDRWRWVNPQAPDNVGLPAPVSKLLNGLAAAD